MFPFLFRPKDAVFHRFSHPFLDIWSSSQWLKSGEGQEGQAVDLDLKGFVVDHGPCSIRQGDIICRRKAGAGEKILCKSCIFYVHVRYFRSSDAFLNWKYLHSTWTGFYRLDGSQLAESWTSGRKSKEMVPVLVCKATSWMVAKSCKPPKTWLKPNKLI